MSAIAEKINADVSEVRRLLDRIKSNVSLLDAADDDARSQANTANQKLDEIDAEYRKLLKDRSV